MTSTSSTASLAPTARSSSCADARARPVASPPDVVLPDPALPGISGLTLTR
ncbi:hypothetical protein [Nocardioides rubriscoriae]|uniref:hypothetical protein n=1 Tax=Nocardioides rubriscoriae TaxID=642762 RepID=UPI001478886E|nr:hypothetical protein [Nocardioides rubriscoriae]